VSVTDLQCCEDSLVKLLQEWGGGVGQTLNLDNVGGWESNTVNALKHYQGQGSWMLDSRTSDTVRKPAFTCMALSLTTAPLTDSYFCVSSSSHTYKVLSILVRKTLWTYTRNIHCTGLNVLPDLAFTFLDDMNWLVYTTTLSNHSNAYSLSHLSNTFTSYNRDIIILFFIS
jgi:hypothetical protein